MTANRTLVSIVLAVSVLALAAGARAYFTIWHKGVPNGQTASSALIRSDFELVDHSGLAATDEDFRGRWQLVFFGFTFCPDICPTTLSTVTAVMEKLGADAEHVVPLFITVDPERDTPAVLADYLANFDSRIVGLTGSPEQIDAAAKAYRVYYSKAENGDAPDGHSMDHSAFLYLMGPGSAYVTHFSHQDDIETIVAKIGEQF
jgi:protein SCO1/2